MNNTTITKHWPPNYATGIDIQLRIEGQLTHQDIIDIAPIIEAIDAYLTRTRPTKERPTDPSGR